MDDTVQGEPSPDIKTLAELTKVYIKIRDKRAENTRIFEAEDKDLEEQQNLIGAEMLETCKKFEADSIRTPHGTIIRSVKSRYWTNDWDSMYQFIKEQGAFGLLEKRLHQTHMKEFLLENPDLLPMGLNVESEYTVTVRRSKEK
jgi:hypothetical protein